MKGKPLWLLGVFVMSACGGRSDLLETWEVPQRGGSGGSSGGRGGAASKGGSAPITGGTFSEGGTFVTGGTVAEAGTAGASECPLAVADCATPSDTSCKRQRKDCVGEILAQFELDSDQDVHVADVATSRDRRVAVAGSFRGKLNVGGHVIDSPPAGDQPFPTAAFVASFDTNGKPEWAYAYSSNTEYEATALRFAPNGEIVFQAHTFYDREPAAVIGRLSPLGQPLWTSAWGQAGHITTGRMGIDNDGRIWLGGSFRSTFDFGGRVFDAGLYSSGYLLELSPDGSLLRSFGVRDQDWLSSEVTGVAVDDEDNVLVVGKGELKNDKKPFAFLQKFSPAGDLVYAKTFEGGIEPTAVAVDRMMRPTLLSHFTGSFSNEGTVFDAGALTNNVWIAQYSREGVLTWQQAFKGNATSTAASTDPFDNIIVAGTGPLVIDGKPLHSDHAADLGTTELSFLMKLRPDGSRVWVHTLDGTVELNGVATDNDAFIWIGSHFFHQIWVDDTQLSTKDTAGLLFELSP